MSDVSGLCLVVENNPYSRLPINPSFKSYSKYHWYIIERGKAPLNCIILWIDMKFKKIKWHIKMVCGKN